MRDVETASKFLPYLQLKAIDDGKGYFAGIDDFCDQEGCNNKATMTYRKVKSGCSQCGDRKTLPPEDVVIRCFCDEHKRRGDCGLDDADSFNSTTESSNLSRATNESTSQEDIMAKRNMNCRKPSGMAGITLTEDPAEPSQAPEAETSVTPSAEKSAARPKNKAKEEQPSNGNVDIGDIRKAAAFANSVGGLETCTVGTPRTVAPRSGTETFTTITRCRSVPKSVAAADAITDTPPHL